MLDLFANTRSSAAPIFVGCASTICHTSTSRPYGFYFFFCSEDFSK